MALEQEQGCATVVTKTNVVRDLSVHMVSPWCQLGIQKGCPGLLRVEETVPGSSYSCVTDGRGQGQGREGAARTQSTCSPGLGRLPSGLFELPHVGKPPVPSPSSQQLCSPDWIPITKMSQLGGAHNRVGSTFSTGR